MDIFSTTSRGKKLKLPNHSFNKGAFLSELVDDALCEYNLNLMKNSNGPNFVYIIGGLPDTTFMIKDRKYEEVIFADSPNKKYQEIISSYLDASHRIRREGAIPVFSTIATMSIHDWNQYRYDKGVTSYLIHSPYYTDMQHNLNETLQIVNRQIFVINNENFVETPNLAGFITTKRGEGKGYRVRYERLKDGCHPVKEIITEWQNLLERVAATNREAHS